VYRFKRLRAMTKRTSVCILTYLYIKIYNNNCNSASVRNGRRYYFYKDFLTGDFIILVYSVVGVNINILMNKSILDYNTIYYMVTGLFIIYQNSNWSVTVYSLKLIIIQYKSIGTILFIFLLILHYLGTCILKRPNLL